MSSKLFLIHCGFYDEEVSGGIYEFHVNLPIVADSLENAKLRVRENAVFRKKKMHIDGIQELSLVDGFRLDLTPIGAQAETAIQPHLHRDL